MTHMELKTIYNEVHNFNVVVGLHFFSFNTTCMYDHYELAPNIEIPLVRMISHVEMLVQKVHGDR